MTALTYLLVAYLIVNTLVVWWAAGVAYTVTYRVSTAVINTAICFLMIWALLA